MAELIPLVALLGIDWADQSHEISLQPGAPQDAGVERHQLPHTPEAIRAWMGELRGRFPVGAVGVAIESSRGPLIHALLDYDWVVLYPVNPRSLARFRETFTPSGAKDDAPDADLLRELLATHRHRLRPWMPDTEATRALRRLVESRRHAVDLPTKFTQQLTAALKEYYPQALDWAGTDLGSEMACEFLLAWPTLEAVQQVRPQRLRSFYTRHHCRRPDRIEARLAAIREATPLTVDRAVIASGVLVVQMLARQLETLGVSIRRFDDEIAARFAAHEDAPLFSALPGSGAALAPRLLAAFGSDRTRFPHASEVQAFSAIAPVRERSGKLGRPLALVRADVRAPDLPRVRAAIDPVLRVGPGLLCAPARPWQGPSCGHPGTGVQVDPHHLALLAGPHAVRRGALPARAGRPAIAADRSPSESEHRLTRRITLDR